MILGVHAAGQPVERRAELQEGQVFAKPCCVPWPAW